MSWIEVAAKTKLEYSQFHKTLLKSSLWMHWISVRFYEMGDTWTMNLINDENMMIVQTLLYTIMHIII